QPPQLPSAVTLISKSKLRHRLLRPDFPDSFSSL
ncbi:MAG: hypothetical protein ACI8XO_004031, partial [Verrucomicrobiales bacterium]